MTPHTDTSRNSPIVTSLICLMMDIWQERELIFTIFIRNIKASVRQSFLGYTWLFLPPIVGTATWFFLNESGVITISETTLPYVVFVAIGQVFWGLLSESIQAPLASFNESKSIFTRINVSPLAFILAGAIKVLFDFCLRLAFLILPLILLFSIQFNLHFILFILLAILTMLFGLTAGMVIVPFGALSQDINRGVVMILPFFMYLTPVIYPTPATGPIHWAHILNPFTYILECSRGILTNAPLTDLPLLLGFSLVGAILLLILFTFFNKSLPHIIERMGM